MTAAGEVISVLQSSSVPIEAQAFLAAVIEGETPQNITTQSDVKCSPWNILYSGAGSLVGTAGLVNPSDAAHIIMVGSYRYWNGPVDSTGFPAWSGGKLANGNFSTAAGGCQDTRTTWNDHHAFGATAFDPQSQVQFNWQLAEQVFLASGHGALLDVLTSGGSKLALIPAYLGRTWPGGCDANFAKRYATNFAALGTPAPPASTDTILDTIVDSQGQTHEHIHRVYAAASPAKLRCSAAAVAGALALTMAAQPVREPPPTLVAGEYGVAKRFAHGLVLECLWTDGRWRRC